MSRLLSFAICLLFLYPCKTNAQVDDRSNQELYWAARKANVYQALYSPESAENLYLKMGALNNYESVNKVLKRIENPDEVTLKRLDNLAEAYDNLVPVREAENTIIDLWEGHDVLPEVEEQTQDTWNTAKARLTDDKNYRPIMSDFRLNDPKSAKGTFVIMPSIRGNPYETYQFALIFNKLGYNVFTIEPRFETVAKNDFDMRYLYLKIDGLRAIRYIRSNAEELGVDANKLITLGASKGNGIHNMVIDFFDMTPNEIFESYGLTPNNYESDELDEVPGNVAVAVSNYGGAEIVSEMERITASNIYSKQNYEQGYMFPDVYILIGNNDRIDYFPEVITTLIDYNNDENRLYDIAWEMHVCDKATHGYGAGVAVRPIPEYNIEHHDPLLNIRTMWNELDAFLQVNLKK